MTTAGGLGAQLFFAAGILDLVVCALPGDQDANIPLLAAIGGLCVALGIGAYLLPWHRWAPRAALPLPIVAFAMMAAGNAYGGVRPFGYAVFFVVVFVWVGMTQPPRTSYWLTPIAAAAYLYPTFVQAHPALDLRASAVIAIPVCVVVGEMLARAGERQRLAHDDLLRERRHEQAVVDALSDGILVVGPHGIVKSCNGAAASLLGRDPESIIGGSSPVPTDGGEPVECQIAGVWLEVVVAALPNPEEKVVALRDVSHQHALDEAKDLFLATTSHELRTPLTAIKGYVATLQRHWSRLDEQERRRALMVVDEQTDALIRLTDHLLLGARAASTPAPRAPFDVTRLVKSCAATYAEVSSRHTVTAGVADDLPSAFGDSAGTSSALAQLVENAIKYSPQGGEVRIEAQTDGDRLILDVLDRGVGLPRGREHTLFEPFSQGDAVNTRSFSGVGLGLYIVRSLVEAQGGEVSALPREGGGSIFRLSLPAVGVVPRPRTAIAV